ncbi:MAG: hypothetical protein ACP5HJ_02935, partial [Candidatus Micrarchaeia archaeon]
MNENEEKQVAWTPYQEITFKFLQKKDLLNNMLISLDLTDAENRDRVLSAFSSLLSSEITPILSPQIKSRLLERLDNLKQLNIIARDNEILTNQFREECFKLLEDISAAQQDVGLGLIQKQKFEVIEKLFATAEVEPILYLPYSTYKIPISPEMVLFALSLINRAHANYDNVIIVDGNPGNGKTTFSIALTIT